MEKVSEGLPATALLLRLSSERVKTLLAGLSALQLHQLWNSGKDIQERMQSELSAEQMEEVVMAALRQPSANCHNAPTPSEGTFGKPTSTGKAATNTPADARSLSSEQQRQRTALKVSARASSHASWPTFSPRTVRRGAKLSSFRLRSQRQVEPATLELMMKNFNEPAAVGGLKESASFAQLPAAAKEEVASALQKRFFRQLTQNEVLEAMKK